MEIEQYNYHYNNFDLLFELSRPASVPHNHRFTAQKASNTRIPFPDSEGISGIPSCLHLTCFPCANMGMIDP